MSIPVCIREKSIVVVHYSHSLDTCLSHYVERNLKSKIIERDEEEKRFNILIGDVSLIEIQKISILDLV
jgi:hypothetical protein